MNIWGKAAIVGTAAITPQKAELVRIEVPAGTFKLYTLNGKDIRVVRCNPKMKKPLTEALECMQKHPKLLPMTYHGCYNPRNIAGTNKPSLHSWGLAIDLNVELAVPLEMVECFEGAGFNWGGRWPGAQYDPMHFEVR